MTLESTIQVLERAIKGRLQDVEESVLQEREVQNILTTFFAEQQARPELVALFKSQSLMYDYLSLSLEEREELDEFRKEHEGYMEGGGTEEFNGHRRLNYIIQSKNSSKLVKRQRYVNRLLLFFDFFLENREENQVFNRNYLRSNRKLKEKFGKSGSNLCPAAVGNFKEEGFLMIIELASEIKSELRKYSDRKEVLKIDSASQLIRMFDFYLENREEGDVFNIRYLTDNEKLRERFGRLGSNLSKKVRKNFKDERGLDKIIELAFETRPEIKNYTTFKETLRVDGPKQLIRMFDFYLENREEGEIFNLAYLHKNQKLKERFGNLGQNLDGNAKNNLGEEGGLDKIIELAFETRPEIKNYTTFKETLRVDGPKQLIRMFDFYLENREEGEIFNANYLRKNQELKNKLGNLGQNLQRNAYNYLKEEGGINYIVNLASRKRPEILQYWKYTKSQKIAKSTTGVQT